MLDLGQEPPLGDGRLLRVRVAGVEQALEHHPAVVDVAVLGQIDPAEAAVGEAAEDLVLAGDQFAGLQLRLEGEPGPAVRAEPLNRPGRPSRRDRPAGRSCRRTACSGAPPGSPAPRRPGRGRERAGSRPARRRGGPATTCCFPGGCGGCGAASGAATPGPAGPVPTAPVPAAPPGGPVPALPDGRRGRGRGRVPCRGRGESEATRRCRSTRPRSSRHTPAWYTSRGRRRRRCHGECGRPPPAGVAIPAVDGPAAARPGALNDGAGHGRRPRPLSSQRRLLVGGDRGGRRGQVARGRPEQFAGAGMALFEAAVLGAATAPPWPGRRPAARAAPRGGRAARSLAAQPPGTRWPLPPPASRSGRVPTRAWSSARPPGAPGPASLAGQAADLRRPGQCQDGDLGSCRSRAAMAS